jgi:hypothetical protein
MRHKLIFGGQCGWGFFKGVLPLEQAVVRAERGLALAKRHGLLLAHFRGSGKEENNQGGDAQRAV